MNTLSLFVFNRAGVSAAHFVKFWSACYDYADGDLYAPNIGKPLTPEGLKALFQWKVDPRFFDHQ